MTNIFTGQFGQEAQTQRVCRVAYTIDNRQPVASTIIGEEPLFYMDMNYEDADFIDEEADFDFMELEALETELLRLAESINAFDRFSEGPAQSAEEKFSDFQTNIKGLTAPHKSAKSDISELLGTLSNSRLAAAYLASAQEHGVEITYGDQVETAAYERSASKIIINPNLDIIDQTLLAARELRRHYQHRAGALINPMMFHPDNAVLVNRVQSADLAANVVRMAWELQLSGNKDVWERLENSPMGDLARAFAREAHLDFRTINNGSANAAVFEAWFLSERCRVEDRTLIQHMLADYQGYVFDEIEAAQGITPSLIAALGEMPFGKNYLSSHALTIMEDPIFTDVRDRSNANFLWFIKFERSFKETEENLEQGLQSSGVSSAAPFVGGNDSDTRDSDTRDCNNGQQDAEIITLFEAGPKERKHKGKPLTQSAEQLGEPSEGDNGSNIVYLRRGPAD